MRVVLREYFCLSFDVTLGDALKWCPKSVPPELQNLAPETMMVSPCMKMWTPLIIS